MLTTKQRISNNMFVDHDSVVDCQGVADQITLHINPALDRISRCGELFFNGNGHTSTGVTGKTKPDFVNAHSERCAKNFIRSRHRNEVAANEPKKHFNLSASETRLRENKVTGRIKEGNFHEQDRKSVEGSHPL